MAYARHIKNGRLQDYAVVANRRTDERLRHREICAACGRAFSAALKPSVDPTLCTECKAAL
jgi:hypothetical protein